MSRETSSRGETRTPTAGRVSVPFFFEPNYDALIAPIKELGGPAAAAAPPAVMYGEPPGKSGW